MELIAQQGGGGAEGAVCICVFYLLIIAVALGIRIMFLLSMSRCFAQISPRNRQMEPGMVWLALIPLFDIVWTIIMIIRLGDSLTSEYRSRGLRPDGDFGKTLGIMYIVLSFACGPFGLICFIMYWVKVAGYTRVLQSDYGYGDYDDYDDDYDDDDDDDDRRPRRRSDRDRDDRDDDRGGREGRPWDRGAR
jgi:hypothetical protein